MFVVSSLAVSPDSIWKPV